MMCTTVLHGGVCHRTSTLHKSGNKMKEKKKKKCDRRMLVCYFCLQYRGYNYNHVPHDYIDLSAVHQVAL